MGLDNHNLSVYYMAKSIKMRNEGIAMRYIYNHDLHIHSQLSLCSSDPEQNNERIVQYAKITVSRPSA